MAWSDNPTAAQIGTIFGWLRWKMPTNKAAAAVKFLEKTATRREVSYEVKRLKELNDKGLLDGKNCFKSEIWEGFDYEGT